ncbi:hypothetical protein EEB14_22730 [Rhodococcus sp. WS4]|nr:hypothetical protein EEB14_22730 [Rhodococcus sp. WS4]
MTSSRSSRKVRRTQIRSVALLPVVLAACCIGVGSPQAEVRQYPWHRDIVATTFWVGEIADPSASDGSQVYSTYDANWLVNYGGCDGVVEADACRTERRDVSNDFFPTRMTPRQNPFYLDLPFDDIHNTAAFAMRADVVPWAEDPGYRGHADDANFSYMKNRWVELRMGDHTCYGQIEDAGPAVYDDANYVFGAHDARPANTRFNGAGLDVSPALNGCLGFQDLNGRNDRLDWRFVEETDVPDGPWTRIVTTSPVVRF